MTETSRINAPEPPRITILMGVLNGAAHLPDQLASIAAQSHSNWHLVCSDDGSTDSSLPILQDFAAAHPGKVTLRRGPQSGFSTNYMGMIRALPRAPGYICFADQDDIWLQNKLARALTCISASGDRPTLYCGRHICWISRSGRRMASRTIARPCTLRNALIENVASGNTVLLNPAAATLARDAARATGAVFAHDWWLYLLMTACEGHVHFDNGPPQILYRQHDANAIGAGRGIIQQICRKRGVINGLFANRISGNLAALAAVDDLLSPAARRLLIDFCAARRAGARARLAIMMRLGPYRQNPLDTLGFWGAASLGRV